MREGQKWVLADEEGYLLTENEPKGSVAVQDGKGEMKRCTVQCVNISITSHRLRWKPINKFSLKTMIKHASPPSSFSPFFSSSPTFPPSLFHLILSVSCSDNGNKLQMGFLN